MSHNVQLITTERKHIIRFLLIDFKNSFNLTNQTATHFKSEKKNCEILTHSKRANCE